MHITKIHAHRRGKTVQVTHSLIGRPRRLLDFASPRRKLRDGATCHPHPHPPEASGRLDPTKCRTVRPWAVQPHWTLTGRRALVQGPPSPRTEAPPVLRPKLVNRPAVGFSIGSTNKPASLDFSATACESPKAPPCIRSLEPSLLVLHFLGGSPSNGPFTLVLHLHKHQPCLPQHLHILSSRKHQSHNVVNHSSHQEATLGRSNPP